MKSIREIAEEISAEFGSEFELDRRELTNAIDKALRDERERCAKIAETHAETHGNMHFGRCEVVVAAAIRKEDQPS